MGMVSTPLSGEEPPKVTWAVSSLTERGKEGRDGLRLVSYRYRNQLTPTSESLVQQHTISDQSEIHSPQAYSPYTS
jgi:hypothetical protein